MSFQKGIKKEAMNHPKLGRRRSTIQGPLGTDAQGPSFNYSAHLMTAHYTGRPPDDNLHRI